MKTFDYTPKEHYIALKKQYEILQNKYDAVLSALYRQETFGYDANIACKQALDKFKKERGYENI